MLHWGGVRNVALFWPQHTSKQRNASSMNEPWQLFCVGQQYLGITALLLSVVTVFFISRLVMSSLR